MKKIIIHNTDKQMTSMAMYNVLVCLEGYHGSMMANFTKGRIELSNGTTIDFRGGDDLKNLMGLAPDFYTTDSEDADRILGRMGGKRLFSLEEVLEKAAAA